MAGAATALWECPRARRRNRWNHEGPWGADVEPAVLCILRSNDAGDLPPIAEGVPAGGEQHCDRCEDQDLGPVLAGAVSDAFGEFTIEGNVPVDTPYILVTKVGRFRRAQQMDPIPEGDACTTVQLPTTMSEGNPTRVPRDRNDGLAVHIPRVAVYTTSTPGGASSPAIGARGGSATGTPPTAPPIRLSGRLRGRRAGAAALRCLHLRRLPRRGVWCGRRRLRWRPRLWRLPRSRRVRCRGCAQPVKSAVPAPHL